MIYRRLGMLGLVEMGIFLGILMVGFVYAWDNGALAPAFFASSGVGVSPLARSRMRTRGPDLPGRRALRSCTTSTL